MNVSWLEVIGYIAGFLTTVCMIPQLVEIIRKRSARDVSLTTFVVLLCGQILWIVYGIYGNDLRIVIPNVISCFVGLCIITFGLVYKKKN